MALNLDPAVLDFIRRKQGLPAEPKLGLDFDWGGDPADPVPAPSQPVAAAPPMAPFADENKAVAELEAIDAERNRSNALGYLGQTFSRAGSMVRGDKVGPLPAPPQVDDSVRKFILTRKLGAATDPLDPKIKALRAALLEKELNAPPKVDRTPVSQEPPDEALVAELTRLGIDPKTVKSRSEALARISTERQIGTKAKEKSAEEKAAEEKAAKESSSKRFLGTYLTPATSDLLPTQQTQLSNELVVPGAQVMEKLAEIHGLIKAIGSAPNPQQLKDLHQLISGALTKYNKVAGLGALSGPDKELLERAMGSVDSLGSIFGNSSGLYDLQASVRNAAQILAKEISTAAGNYGSKPVAGSPLDFGAWEGRAQAAYAARSGKGAAKRPTRTLDGVTKEWNGKAWVNPGEP